MKTLRTIHSKAPTRIDLAGGTLDIWPLYLFLPRATTINLAIDLFAETTLKELDEPKIILRSGDQSSELTLDWNSLETAQFPPQLELHGKYLRYFLARKKRAGRFIPTLGIEIETRAKSPAGAGLGGSSTLSVSIIGALQVWADEILDIARNGESLVEITRDVETTVIKVPAGLQDYYGAMFGGLQSLRWGAGRHERYNHPRELLADIDDRLLLFYSGHSRNSGINNWTLFKSFIDNAGKVRNQFHSINHATHQLEKALNEKDWKSVGNAIALEWMTRRELAPGISTPEIDQAFDIAMRSGATAGKICGAGGGGCFFVYVPNRDFATKQNIVADICKIPGIKPLPFKAVPHGLEVKID